MAGMLDVGEHTVTQWLAAKEGCAARAAPRIGGSLFAMLNACLPLDCGRGEFRWNGLSTVDRHIEEEFLGLEPLQREERRVNMRC